MNELPGDLLYTNDHEWLRRESDGSVTVGITEHAAAALGDLVGPARDLRVLFDVFKDGAF